MYKIYTINSRNNHKKTSFKFFHANFLKINVYHTIYYLETHESNIYKNSFNYHKTTSFMSFHANFFNINVYHYYILSRDSCIKYKQ